MRRIVIAVLVLLAATTVGAIELRAVLDQPLDMGQNVKCLTVIVNPAYVPGQSPECVVAAIPSNANRLIWQATELWEKPPQVSDSEKRRLAGSVQQYDGWTKLTCGATGSGMLWSFSCFDSGLIEQWQGRAMSGRFDGAAAQLDGVVRAWWNAQR